MITKIFITVSFAIVFLRFCATPVVSVKMKSYAIQTLWNSEPVAVVDYIQLHFEYVDNSETKRQDLHIKVHAPFYDDPRINDTVPMGSMDKLWEYEVVEVFLLGSDEHYLEIEFSPKGQYLLLQLHGYRNIVKYPLYIDNYSAEIHDEKWTGSYVIPWKYMPPNLSKFNAYAIHGSDDARKYLALFPTPSGKYKDPDFHRLDYFQDFEL